MLVYSIILRETLAYLGGDIFKSLLLFSTHTFPSLRAFLTELSKHDLISWVLLPVLISAYLCGDNYKIKPIYFNNTIIYNMLSHRSMYTCVYLNNIYRYFIDIEFYRQAIGFQKVSIISLPQYLNTTLIVYVYAIIIIIIIHKSGSFRDLPS